MEKLDLNTLIPKIRSDIRINFELKRKEDRRRDEDRQRFFEQNEIIRHNYWQMLYRMNDDPEYFKRLSGKLLKTLKQWNKIGLPGGFYLECWLDLLHSEYPVMYRKDGTPPREKYFDRTKYLEDTIKEVENGELNLDTIPPVILDFFETEYATQEGFAVMGFMSSTPFIDTFFAGHRRKYHWNKETWQFE